MPAGKLSRVRSREGSHSAPWVLEGQCDAVAAPAEDVARRLGVSVEEVHAAGVEPYLAADGRRLLSVHLVGVALGLRASRLDRARKRQRRSPEAAARRRLRDTSTERNRRRAERRAAELPAT